MDDNRSSNTDAHSGPEFLSAPSIAEVEQSPSQNFDRQHDSPVQEGTPATEEQDLTGGDAQGQDEATRIRQLAATVRDQDDLEKDVGRQADQMLLKQADERDRKRLERTEKEREYALSPSCMSDRDDELTCPFTQKIVVRD